MEIIDWYIAVLRKYSRFQGRASRKEFWSFILVDLLISLPFGIVINNITNLSKDFPSNNNFASSSATIVFSIYLAYLLGRFIPYLAVTVRRLHDTGRSGWWYLISLITLIGSIILIFFLIEDSQPGKNKYGTNPKDNNM